MNAKDLIEQIRLRGVSVAEIAREIDRSPRMVYAIVRGETSGASFRNALNEIAVKGRVFTTPPRRRTKDGTLAPVRGKGGVSVEPEHHIRKLNEEPQGGRFTTATTFLTAGGRQHEVRLPKSLKAQGRQRGNEAILSHIRAAARSQAGTTQKRVNLEVILSDGFTFPVKDYNASTLLHDMKGNAIDFLANMIRYRYPEIDLRQNPVTGIDIVAYNTVKTTQYYQNRDKRRTS